MTKYTHIFFDLDHTLYDFDKSSYETFSELYYKYCLFDKGIENLDNCYTRYRKINEELWALYKEGKLEKKFLNVQRFYLTFKEFGIDDRTFAEHFAIDYITESPLKLCLFPGAWEVLNYLQDKYKLHIITNGFEEVQFKKIKANELNKYFQTITTSEEAGVKKPFSGIFELALQKAEAKVCESLMIGDDIEVDIKGAKSVGMDQMFFNIENIQHSDLITFEINSLYDIVNIL
ncbi:MAG: YjjG family noncanonical pyrimidine nucleotidase [Bacteroidales bacterium]|nr:YjjG family noncanonical pyrimidine nucleotidase [Bacteroidales bacterium]